MNKKSVHLCKKLLRDFAEREGLDLRKLTGQRRFRDVAWPRQDFMLLARRLGYSFPIIAQALGGRDHTTIMHGVRAAEERERQQAGSGERTAT